MTNYFICSTPFHIISMVYLIKGYYLNDKNVVFLCNHFKSAKKLCDILENETFIEKTYFINDENLRRLRKSNFSNKVRLLHVYLSKTTLNKYCKISEVPDKVIFFSFTLFNTLILSFAKQSNPNVEYLIGEDGNRDYLYDDFGVRETGMFRFVMNLTKKMGHEIVFIPPQYTRCLYRPELQSLKGGGRFIPIANENIIYREKEQLNRIFGFKKEMIIKNKYIFFESIIEEKMELQKKIMGICSQYEDDIILKRHPRSKVFYQTFKLYDYEEIPWEIICMNADIENKVLISINSNACLTPKIMFNKEPILIFLYKILLDSKEQKENEQFFLRFAKLYSQKNRIIIPETMEELKESLINMRSKNEKY